jgi:hypothetical protein
MTRAPARSVVYRGTSYTLTHTGSAHVWTIAETAGGGVIAHVTRAPKGALDVHPVRRGFSALHGAAIFAASEPAGAGAGARAYATFVEFGGETFEVSVRYDGFWEFFRPRDDRKLGEVSPASPGRVAAAEGADAGQLGRLARFVGATHG